MSSHLNAAKTRTASAVRPSRLNSAGECRYCLTPNCRAAICIVVHSATIWETCRVCGGGGYDGPFDKYPCRICETEGLAMIDAPKTVGIPAAETVIRFYCDRIYGAEPVYVVAAPVVDMTARRGL